MVYYRRSRVKGGTYFFTLTLHDRGSQLLIKYISALKNAMRKARQRQRYNTNALVILPNHLHAMWTLPSGDCDYSGRWRQIKQDFTKVVIKYEPISKNKRGEYQLWQRRFWEHTIKTDIDYQQHIDYIHYNPVKHGLVKQVKDWPYSTFHYYVSQGLLPDNWSGIVDDDSISGFGEI